MVSSAAFRCSVITPERQVLDTQATFLAFPAHDGEMGVLQDRAPLVCKLGIGVMRLETVDGEQRLFIDGGFAEVLKNQVTILTEQALRPDEVNPEAVRKSLREAQERHPATLEDIETRQRDIARATAKLKVAHASTTTSD